METPKVKCVKCAIRPTYIDKPPVVVNDFAANAMDTPALAIPTANVERVKKLLREAWYDATNPGIEAAIEQALALLEPNQ